MLDTDYIERLFKELPWEKKKELQIKLFGDTKQSMNYFRKIKDPGLSKLEILADFFEMPIDCLRLDSKFRRNPDLNPTIKMEGAKGEKSEPESENRTNADKYDLILHKLIEEVESKENGSLLRVIANTILENLDKNN